MVSIERKGDNIVITFPATDAVLAAAKPSSTGKTLTVATTNGFTKVGPVAISMNAYIPNPAYVKA